MEVTRFSEIEQEFTVRVEQMVWCNLATVDSKGRPRSRVLHPVWEATIAWAVSRRDALKGQHITANPYVSLAYVADAFKPVYVEATAQWVDDMDEKRRLWDYIAGKPEPIGFDLNMVFAQGVEDPSYGLLKFTPWRIQLDQFPAESTVWRA